ncbi:MULTISPECIES: Clp protease N-terminal domain-containing protein [Nocardia]|uniref:Clp protease N-terminal domain-containing protein n=1 Tax=Nocardia TaxID=1817 RepID=UPI0007EB0A90|nr:MULTISPECIES: Clp protease N-terminal domain-containing protein [Nocardia]MBF6274843.1 Clp protease [Nocardia nova]OBA53288.1 Clp protease [Nocardia sp. 852002-51101_SCH5132738]OBB29559.1 Clp protease [Nocardia sp. 852002-51244_SCH5132740]OBF66078.1 Clp protease [Mycobacterium sp. 852002-51759_SCH5129042]
MFERFAKAARSAVVDAQEEARELRSPSIDVEHLLLGLATCADDQLRQVLEDNGITAEAIRHALPSRVRTEEPLGEEDAAALKSIGIDLDAVRDSVQATFGEGAFDEAVPVPDKGRGRFRFGGGMSFGHIPFTREAKKTLELSLREAISRGDDRIEAGHVLLGILRAPNPATRELLGGNEGMERVRGAVQEMLDRAA